MEAPRIRVLSTSKKAPARGSGTICRWSTAAAAGDAAPATAGAPRGTPRDGGAPACDFAVVGGGAGVLSVSDEILGGITSQITGAAVYGRIIGVPVIAIPVIAVAPGTAAGSCRRCS